MTGSSFKVPAFPTFLSLFQFGWVVGLFLVSMHFLSWLHERHQVSVELLQAGDAEEDVKHHL